MKKINKKYIAIFLINIIMNFQTNYFLVMAQDININARCAIAMDCKTKTVLYDKNGNDLVPMASTTKIMTALVAIKYGNLDRKVEISSKSANIHGSTVGYKKGEQISIRELLYGLMLRSGNDAAIAIAEGIGGSVDEFVNLMNEYAHSIGLSNTHFESPHGLDSNEHYCTVYDLAMITCKAKETKIFNQIVNSKDIDSKAYNFSRSYHNINKILWLLPDATGVKTGYTGNAGKCLVSSFNIKDNDIVVIVLNSVGRWNETKKIHDYVVKNYDFKKMYSKGEKVGEVLFQNDSKVNLLCDRDIIVPLKQGSNYQVKINVPQDKIFVPVPKGSYMGCLNIYEDDKLVFSEALVNDDDIKSQSNIKKWFFLK